MLSDPINFVDFEGQSLMDTVKEWGMRASNAAAGALDDITGGLSNRIAGVDGTCAGPGYGFGQTLAALNPRGAASRLAKGILKRFAKEGKKSSKPKPDPPKVTVKDGKVEVPRKPSKAELGDPRQEMDKGKVAVEKERHSKKKSIAGMLDPDPTDV